MSPKGLFAIHGIHDFHNARDGYAVSALGNDWGCKYCRHTACQLFAHNAGLHHAMASKLHCIMTLQGQHSIHNMGPKHDKSLQKARRPRGQTGVSDLGVDQLQLLVLFFQQEDLLVEEAVVLAPLAAPAHLPVLLPQLCSRLLHSHASAQACVSTGHHNRTPCSVGVVLPETAMELCGATSRHCLTQSPAAGRLKGAECSDEWPEIMLKL